MNHPHTISFGHNDSSILNVLETKDNLEKAREDWHQHPKFAVVHQYSRGVGYHSRSHRIYPTIGVVTAVTLALWTTAYWWCEGNSELPTEVGIKSPGNAKKRVQRRAKPCFSKKCHYFTYLAILYIQIYIIKEYIYTYDDIVSRIY